MRQSVITKYYQVLMRDRQIIADRFNVVGIMARLISELLELTKTCITSDNERDISTESIVVGIFYCWRTV